MNGFGYWHDGTGVEGFYNRIKPLQDAPVWNFAHYNPDLVIIALGHRLLRRADWSPPTFLRNGETLQRLTEPAVTVGQNDSSTISIG